MWNKHFDEITKKAFKRLCHLRKCHRAYFPTNLVSTKFTLNLYVVIKLYACNKILGKDIYRARLLVHCSYNSKFVDQKMLIMNYVKVSM